MEDDGTVDEEALLAIAPEDMKARMEPVIKKCGTQGNFKQNDPKICTFLLSLLNLFLVGSDPCDTAFRTNKCWYENAPNVSFAINLRNLQINYFLFFFCRTTCSYK